MERWVGRVAVVTGASSGIGSQVVVDLLKAGVIVVGLARRVERVQALASKVDAKFAASLHAVKCDISKEDEIKSTFAWIEERLGGVDILVNNAGIFHFEGVKLIDADNSDIIKNTLDTNVLGPVFCTREAYQSMKRRSVTDGHIVIINSLVGHKVLVIPGLSFNIYPSSKHAVTAIAEVLRQEFNAEKTKIKISSISPGGVNTEMVPEEFKGLVPLLNPEDLSNAILYVLGTPPHVQVHELTIRPLGEEY